MATPWSDVVYLAHQGKGRDKDGFPDNSEGEPRQVFANKKSVRSQEFYLAKQNGYELTHMFEVRSVEYEGEEVLYYHENRNLVLRTYEKGEFVELICMKRSDDHAP
ncbi:hypothetical protein ACE106_07405 [Shouchella clausii]|uniref:hypothetical protein n=1 Tax=Shouchella clausii TaxID=79880 RepID=UPI000787E6E7|nr:hypothetical protein [Shouchella clausii]